MAADLVEQYLDALTGEDVVGVLATLAPDVVFQSPFNTWHGRAIGKVYAARFGAFGDLELESVILDDDRAAILWRATVDGRQVESSEVLTIADGVISRVDAFLRPADVLESVHAAMTAAWPAWSRARVPLLRPVIELDQLGAE
jgi:ketosteroid isomerase-like protein